MRRAKYLTIKRLQKKHPHPQGATSIFGAFLNQRASAYRFHESLNLGVNQMSKIYKISQTAIYKWGYKYGSLPKGERMVIEKESEGTKTISLMKKVTELEQFQKVGYGKIIHC